MRVMPLRPTQSGERRVPFWLSETSMVEARVGQASRSERETRNVLDPVAIPSAMEEGPLPGARVRATTKHGTLTVDEIAAMQPGMARLMDELSRRYWVLYYAAKAGNWE